MIATISASVVLAASAVAQLEDLGFTFQTIGSPGNPAYVVPADRAGPLTRDVDGRGSVDYVYRMSRTEISVGQYVTFINNFTPGSEALTDLLEPPVSSLAASTFLPVGERYVVPRGLENTQIGLDVPQIMMFINWLHNDQSNDVSAILDGAYDVGAINGAGSIVLNSQAQRQEGARFWIPTLDEYLKAAHFDPHKDGDDPGWWDYAHSSDEEPVNGLPGEGDVARELTNEEVRSLTMGESANHAALPLELFPESTSPWGILDLLGGRRELIDDRPVAEEDLDRLIVKRSSDTSTELSFDADIIDATSTGRFFFSGLNTHIVTRVPSSSTTSALAITSLVLCRRRRDNLPL